MATYEIPLTPMAQTFPIALAGVTYNLTLIWRAGSGWVLDIADALGTPMVRGIALTTGADLLAQYGYLGFGGQLFVQTDNDLTAPPTFTNLGVNAHLYFATSS